MRPTRAREYTHPRQGSRLSMPRRRPPAGKGEDNDRERSESKPSFDQVGFKRGNGLPLPRGSRELQPGYLAMPRVQVAPAMISMLDLLSSS